MFHKKKRSHIRTKNWVKTQTCKPSRSNKTNNSDPQNQHTCTATFVYSSALGKQFTHNSTISFEKQPTTSTFKTKRSPPHWNLKTILSAQPPNWNQKQTGDSNFEWSDFFDWSHKVALCHFLPRGRCMQLVGVSYKPWHPNFVCHGWPTGFEWNHFCWISTSPRKYMRCDYTNCRHLCWHTDVS